MLCFVILFTCTEFIIYIQGKNWRGLCGHRPIEQNIQLINFLGTSKYIQTIGKTCNAPQITSIQKAHYQHKSQFPYCAGRVGRSSLPTSRTGKTIGISTAALDHQPTRLPPGKSQKPLPGRHCQNATTARQEKSTPDFSRHQEPACLWRSTARDPF